MNIREFLKKLQDQPEDIKKRILWSVVVIIGLVLLFFWLRDIKIRLNKFQKENIFEGLSLPQLQEELKETPEINIPGFEIPQMGEEDLKELEEMMKETENTSTQP